MMYKYIPPTSDSHLLSADARSSITAARTGILNSLYRYMASKYPAEAASRLSKLLLINNSMAVLVRGQL